MKKKLFNCLLILLIILCIYSFLLTTPIFTNDELWIFGHLYKFHNGYTLYEDINAITPPVFYYLGYLILSIFSFTILGFRIYNLIIYLFLIFVIKKILEKLEISKEFIPIYLVLIILFLTQNILAGANYNILSILFFMIGMYLYISKKTNNLFQGFLIYLCLFTKQNLGFFYILIVLINELIIYKKINFKYIKNQLIKFLYCLIPTSATLLHLYFMGSLNGFFNYCIGGLFAFNDSIFRFTVPIYLLIILILSIIIYLITLLLKNKLNNKINNVFFENMNILFVFFIGIIPIVYPILDSTHFLYTIPFAFIILFYFFDYLLFKELFSVKKLRVASSIITFSVIFLITIRNFSIFYLNKKNYHHYVDTVSPYRLLYIDNNLYLKNEKLKEFILEQKQLGNTVKILSYEAYLSTIELKNSNGKYDLFFLGNLGFDDTNTSINEIKNSKKTFYLIMTNPENWFYQESIEVKNYIITNLDYKGTISDYSIYFID